MQGKWQSTINYGVFRYEAKMEELKEKFPDSAKMKAKYEVYIKKRTLIV